MKNLQYFFLSIVFILLFENNSSGQTFICLTDCDTLDFQYISHTCYLFPDDEDYDCSQCLVNVDYSYREGYCNNSYVRELYIYNIQFQNCLYPNCPNTSLDNTRERFLHAIWCVLKNHDWEEDDGQFWVTVYYPRCWKTLNSGMPNKRYLMCHIHNYCCGMKYQLGSSSGEPPYDYINLDTTDQSYSCEPPDTCSQYDSCKTCVCSWNLSDFNYLLPFMEIKFDDDINNNNVFIKIKRECLEIVNNCNNSFIFSIYSLFGLKVFEYQAPQNIICKVINFRDINLCNGIYFYKIIPLINKDMIIGKFIYIVE